MIVTRQPLRASRFASMLTTRSVPPAPMPDRTIAVAKPRASSVPPSTFCIQVPRPMLDGSRQQGLRQCRPDPTAPLPSPPPRPRRQRAKQQQRNPVIGEGVGGSTFPQGQEQTGNLGLCERLPEIGKAWCRERGCQYV